LCQDYSQFTSRGAELIALGPDGPNAFKRYWAENAIPFTGCADIKSKVSDRFYQEVNLWKLGRMPAIFVIDRQGKVRFAHYGDSMSDIPSNETVLAVLDQVIAESLTFPG
jgi:peroxiredoxin Q/BCP